MSSIVTDIINRQLSASASPSAEAGKRLIALAAMMETMPNCARTLRDLGLAESAVLAAQTGEVFALHDLDAALDKAGLDTAGRIEFKMQLKKCRLL